ncbi:MAG: hypothetical protein EOP48_12710 [Sphingobacteriales bacterium]|nr:MAG: hypothetical protein EOP48_12710 [Sphingobacteriales bacterium]
MFEINASIATHERRIWCAYRTQHLFQYDAKSCLTELDARLNPISIKPLKAENGNTAFEDVRLYSHGDSLLAFYTYFPYDEQGGWKWQYGVGVGTVDTSSGLIRDQLSLRPFSKRMHEKNWCAYSFAGELYLVTDYEPFLRILSIESEKINLKIQEYYHHPSKTLGWPYGEIRGGTPLLAKPNGDDGWMYGFVHSYLSHTNGFSRFYYFTAARLNHLTKEFQYYPIPLEFDQEELDADHDKLWYYSNQRQRKVIFPMGIMYYKKGILVSFGRDDVSSFSKYFTWKEMDNFFKDF